MTKIIDLFFGLVTAVFAILMTLVNLWLLAIIVVPGIAFMLFLLRMLGVL